MSQMPPNLMAQPDPPDDPDEEDTVSVRSVAPSVRVPPAGEDKWARFLDLSLDEKLGYFKNSSMASELRVDLDKKPDDTGTKWHSLNFCVREVVDDFLMNIRLEPRNEPRGRQRAYDTLLRFRFSQKLASGSKKQAAEAWNGQRSQLVMLLRDALVYGCRWDTVMRSLISVANKPQSEGGNASAYTIMCQVVGTRACLTIFPPAAAEVLLSRLDHTWSDGAHAAVVEQVDDLGVDLAVKHHLRNLDRLRHVLEVELDLRQHLEQRRAEQRRLRDL